MSAPARPPRAWFRDPKLAGLTALTVTDDGRVYGHAAGWGTCHTGYPGRCMTPPRGDGYAYFHLKSVETDDGPVKCGTVTVSTGHANRELDALHAVDHYDDTGTAAADVCVGDDRFGIWVAGAVRPNLGAARLRELRGAALSGDWRPIGGRLQLVGLLGVNVPGFPVPHPSAVLVASGGQVELSALVSAGIVSGETGECGDATVSGPGASTITAAELQALIDRGTPRPRTVRRPPPRRLAAVPEPPPTPPPAAAPREDHRRGWQRLFTPAKPTGGRRWL